MSTSKLPSPSAVTPANAAHQRIAGAPAPTATPPPIPMLWLMLLSGTAASWGEFCTIPFDTAKVRLQLQDTAKPTYRGLFHVLSSMVRDEGATVPWRGVSAGIQRQMAFAPIRIGLYEPVRNFYTGKDHVGPPTVLQKIAAGLTTSAIGITVASPTDVVKVRLQAEGRLPPGVPRRYAGALDAYRKIVQQEGVMGLWTGYGPNLARNWYTAQAHSSRQCLQCTPRAQQQTRACVVWLRVVLLLSAVLLCCSVVNATELVAYDQAKQTLLGPTVGMQDSIGAHILAGLSAGLAATLLGSPVDVVKTRVMNAKKGDGAAPFKGPLDCAAWLLRTQGPTAFYKGFIPNFTRIGSWNIVTWVTLEQLKRLYYEHVAAQPAVSAKLH